MERGRRSGMEDVRESNWLYNGRWKIDVYELCNEWSRVNVLYWAYVLSWSKWMLCDFGRYVSLVVGKCRSWLSAVVDYTVHSCLIDAPHTCSLSLSLSPPPRLHLLVDLIWFRWWRIVWYYVRLRFIVGRWPGVKPFSFSLQPVYYSIIPFSHSRQQHTYTEMAHMYIDTRIWMMVTHHVIHPRRTWHLSHRVDLILMISHLWVANISHSNSTIKHMNHTHCNCAED